jgi:hypothetical protein
VDSLEICRDTVVVRTCLRDESRAPARNGARRRFCAGRLVGQQGASSARDSAVTGVSHSTATRGLGKAVTSLRGSEALEAVAVAGMRNNFQKNLLHSRFPLLVSPLRFPGSGCGQRFFRHDR